MDAAKENIENGSINKMTVDTIFDEKKTIGQRIKEQFKENLLLLLLLISLGIGVGMGAGLRSLDPPFDKRQLMYFRFPGDLLMRMLKMLILPLIVSSLISGLASLDAKTSGKMGLRAIVYYLATTFIAVIIGIILVMTIRPGKQTGTVVEEGQRPAPANTADSFLDLIRNMLPDNLVVACFKQTKTQQIPNVSNVTIRNGTENITQEVTTYDFSVNQEDGMNVLGLVVFSVAFGIIISRMGPAGKPLVNFFLAMADAVMQLVVVVIWYSPIGIMFLVAAQIIAMQDPIQDLKALGMYMVTVLTGLAIHGIIILPLLYFAFVRKNPLVYLLRTSQALATALGTASSSATLPVTYRCLEVKNKVDPRVTRFVLPVGATINMDGTALYEAVAAIFIAQLRGIELNVGQIIAASITATAASIGAASVPQAGIVTMVIVLTALGLPSDDVAKILAVDWLLDRFRTMINVEGDSIGAAIVAHLSRHDLKKSDEAHVDEGEPAGSINEGYIAETQPNGDIPSVTVLYEAHTKL